MRDRVRGRPRSPRARQAPLRGTMGLKIGTESGRETPGYHRAPAPISLGSGAGAVLLPRVLPPKLGTYERPCVRHGRGHTVTWQTGE
jgi:hypothetical protein